MGLHSPCSRRAWNQILHYGIREHQHFSKGCTLLNTFKTLSTDSIDCNIEVQTKGPEQDDWETSWVVTSVAVSANLSCDFMWCLHFWNEKPVVFHTFFISKTTRWPSQIQQLDEMSKRTRWAWRRAREPRPDQIRTRFNLDETNETINSDQMLSDSQRCSACHWVLSCLAASFPLSGCQAASPRASVDYLGVSPDASEPYAPRIVPGRRGLSQIAKQRTSQIPAETACARYDTVDTLVLVLHFYKSLVLSTYHVITCHYCTAQADNDSNDSNQNLPKRQVHLCVRLCLCDVCRLSSDTPNHSPTLGPDWLEGLVQFISQQSCRSVRPCPFTIHRIYYDWCMS